MSLTVEYKQVFDYAYKEIIWNWWIIFSFILFNRMMNMGMPEPMQMCGGCGGGGYGGDMGGYGGGGTMMMSYGGGGGGGGGY